MLATRMGMGDVPLGDLAQVSDADEVVWHATDPRRLTTRGPFARPLPAVRS